MPRSRKRDLEPDVAHHRRDDGVARQPAAILAGRSADISRMASPSTILPVVIDEQRAIAVAVERHAEPAPRSRPRPLASPSRCVDPQSRLMLRPSGVTPIASTSNPSCAKSAGASGAVAPFAQSTTMRRSGERPGGLQDLAAGAERNAAADAPCDRVRGGDPSALPEPPRRIGNQRLDRRLELLGQLLAGAAEHLDAVVFVGIVRRGDHDAGIEALGARQIRDAGVGTTPALTTVAPSDSSSRAPARPRSTLPDSRVSRPITTRSRCAVRDCRRCRQPPWHAPAPRRRARPSPDRAARCPALPRMPSVPNSFMVVSAQSSP